MSSHHQTLLIIFISPPVITIHQPPSKVTDLSKSALLANGDTRPLVNCTLHTVHSSTNFVTLKVTHTVHVLVLDQEEDLGHEDHPSRGKQVGD